MFGVDATVERSVVRATEPNDTNAIGGLGVAALSTGAPSRLSLRESLISSSHTAGLELGGADATVQRCLLRDTQPGRDDSAVLGWGDGIALRQSGYATQHASRLTLEDSLVDTSARAGLVLYEASSGSVRRSVFRKGVLAIDLEDASTVDGDDNVYEGNVENRVTWGNKLAPSPTPQIPSLEPPKP
jgi:hypothetical protein